VDPSDWLEKQAILIESVPPEVGQQMLAVYQQSAPTAFGFLMKRIQAIQGIDPVAVAQQQMQMQQMQAQDRMGQKDLEREKEKHQIQEKHEKAQNERKIEATGVDMAKKEHDLEIAKQQPKPTGGKK
jgi:hypothetical protein